MSNDPMSRMEDRMVLRLEEAARVLDEIKANVAAIKSDIALMRPPTIVRIQNADD